MIYILNCVFYSRPFSAEVKNGRSYTPNPHYDFMSGNGKLYFYLVFYTVNQFPPWYLKFPAMEKFF